MVIIGTDLAQGQTIRANQGFDSRLSKALTLNTDNRLFFLKTQGGAGKTIVAATVAGRSLNYDIFGSSFFNPNDDQLVYDDATGQWKDISGLDDWARIARVLHAAEAADKKYNAEQKIRSDADRVGKDIDDTGLKNAIDAIDLEYFGGKDPLNNKIYPKVNPMISNLVFKTTTQVLIVPMTGEGGAPDFSAVKTAYLEMSSRKTKQLDAILNNPDYNDPELPYIEVAYSYKGADTQKAGADAVFQNVSKDLSLKAKFPDLWAANWESTFSRMVSGKTEAETAEMMARRNIGLCGTIGPKDIEACVRKYCASSAGVLASINMESDDTKKAAKLFMKYGLLDSTPKIKTNLEELIASMEAENGAQVEELDEIDQMEQKVMQAKKDTEGIHDLQTIAEKVDLDVVGGDFGDEM